MIKRKSKWSISTYHSADWWYNEELGWISYSSIHRFPLHSFSSHESDITLCVIARIKAQKLANKSGKTVTLFRRDQRSIEEYKVKPNG